MSQPLPHLPALRRRLHLAFGLLVVQQAALAALLPAGGWLVIHGALRASAERVLLGTALLLGWWLLGPRRRPRAAPTTEDESLPLDRASERQLYELVDRIAEQVGLQAPVELHLVPGAGSGCHFVAGGRLQLRMGMAELQTLQTAQVEALIAFHLARAALGAVRIRARFEALLRYFADNREAARFASAGLTLLAHRFAAYHSAALATADARAASVAGVRAVGIAYRREVLLGWLFQRFLVEELQPVLKEGLVPADVWRGFGLFVEAFEESGALQEREAHAIADANGIWQDLAQRLSALRESPDAPVALRVGGSHPARSLLFDAAGLELRCAARFTGPATRGQSIGWEDVADRVWAPRFARAARDLRKALPPGTRLESALGWLSASTQVALAGAAWPRLLESPADREERERRARQLVLRGLAGWLGEELLVRGWRWETAPGWAVELVAPDGERIAPLALLSPLGQEPGAEAELRARLEAVGLRGGRPAPAGRVGRSLLH